MKQGAGVNFDRSEQRNGHQLNFHSKLKFKGHISDSSIVE